MWTRKDEKHSMEWAGATDPTPTHAGGKTSIWWGPLGKPNVALALGFKAVQPRRGSGDFRANQQQQAKPQSRRRVHVCMP